MSETPPTKLYTALLAAQRDFGPVIKNATNPAFRTKYADLGAVLDSVTEPLAKHGILLVQRFDHDQGGAILVTELIHAASGETLQSAVPVVAKDPTDPQKMGGAITYYRRYSLLALLGIAPEDDDGNAAAKPAPARPQRPQERAAPQPPPPGPGVDATFLSAQIDLAWTAWENGKGLDEARALLRRAWKQADAAQRALIEGEIAKLESEDAERATARPPASAG